MGLGKLVTLAPTRRELYNLCSKEYDLPNYGPCITVDYLKEINKIESKFLKVPRNKTNKLPPAAKRFWNSLEAFNCLT